MQAKHILNLLSTAIALGAPLGLSAQEKAKSEEVKRPDGQAQEASEKPRSERPETQERRGPQQPIMKPTSFIGIMTRTPSPDVRAQVGVPEGFGLLVEEIMEESPAKTAGIQQYDVLVLLGDQRLVNMDQLSALIRDTPKDSSVVFTLKRAGKEEKVTVKVGEKMMAVAPSSQRPWGEQMERFGQQMREQAERMKQNVTDFARDTENKLHQERDRFMPNGPGKNEGMNRPGPNNNDSRRERDIPRQQPNDHRGPNPAPQNNRPHNDRDNSNTTSTSSSTSSSVATADGKTQSATNSQSNVIRRDDTGEYALAENNGKKIFSVKPTEGEAKVYEVTTEDQVQALPEVLRDKLNELNRVGHEAAVAGAK